MLYIVGGNRLAKQIGPPHAEREVAKTSCADGSDYGWRARFYILAISS